MHLFVCLYLFLFWYCNFKMKDHIRVQITTTTVIVGGGFGHSGVLVIIIVVHDYRYSLYKTSINLYQTFSLTLLFRKKVRQQWHHSPWSPWVYPCCMPCSSEVTSDAMLMLDRLDMKLSVFSWCFLCVYSSHSSDSVLHGLLWYPLSEVLLW